MKHGSLVMMVLILPLSGCPGEEKATPGGADPAAVSTGLAASLANVASKAKAGGKVARDAGKVALVLADRARGHAKELVADPEARPVLKRAAWKAVRGKRLEAGLLLISLMPVQDPETGEVVRYGDLMRKRLETMAELDEYDPEAVAFLLMLDPRSFNEARVLRTGPGTWGTPAEATGELKALVKDSPSALKTASKAALSRDEEACLAALRPLPYGVLELHRKYLKPSAQALLDDSRTKLEAGDLEGFQKSYREYVDQVVTEANADR